MNGRVARKLRGIARRLELPAKTSYDFGKPGALTRESRKGNQARVMIECFRRAYKEAKKLYLGKPLTVLVPETEKTETFAAKVVDSVREYASQD